MSVMIPCGHCQQTFRRVRAARYCSLSCRFWAKVEVTDDCWLWTASLSASGYGTFAMAWPKRVVPAHRVALLLGGVEIPEGMQVDHLCRTRRCVNPAHLEVVTPRENTLRGMSPIAVSVRTNRCMEGHEFTPENTVIQPSGYRRCRTCLNARQREHRAAQRRTVA